MYPSYDSYSGYPSPMTYPSYDMYSPFDPNFPYYANPSYRQPKIEPPNQHIKHNSNYWCPLGWIRIFILLSTLGGIIASWCIVSNDSNFASIDPGLMSTRSALIVMFSVFFSLSLFQFLMSVSNFVNLPGIDSKYYLYAFVIIDLCGAIAFIGVGIAAAVRESYLYSLVGVALGYRLGTLTACAVFAFFAAVLELASAGYQAYVVYELDFI